MTSSPTLALTMLGAGQEVGRSCCVLQYRGKTVVCDAGVQPAFSGIASLPFIDELDWRTVDVLLITHFHVDHAAALTYITEKTNFREGKGQVYMSHATKALHRLMMQDFVRMSSASSEALFSAQDLAMSLSLIKTVSAHQLITPCPGISFTPYHAGHVLGACMFFIDIAGLKILYTGDYSREEDRHLLKAELPPVRPDVLIVESTFGIKSLEPRPEKEQRFTTLVHQIIRRGGHVLLPTFAVGPAQELMLVLEEYWKAHPDLHDVPIYYTSNSAHKSMAVYQTNINTMNANIRARFAQRDNPFVFKYISSLSQSRGWEKSIADGPPCVVLASPGFMQTGPSRAVFELLAPDARNGVVITGFSIKGTLARELLDQPAEIESVKGGGLMIPRRISVAEIPFSAHVDYSQNAEFIELVDAQHVVLVHGEKNTMADLKAAMTFRYKERGKILSIHTPRNLETLELTFPEERVAKVIGHLANISAQTDNVISGLLVSKDFSYALLDPRDLTAFSGLPTSTLTQRQKVAIGVKWELIRWHLEGLFGAVEEGRDHDEQGVAVIRIMDAITLTHTQEYELTLEWESSAQNDMLADSALALIVGIEKSPASLKVSSCPQAHEHPHSDHNAVSTREQRLAWFLEAHFEDVRLHAGEGDEGSNITIAIDGNVATVDVDTLIVRCENENLKTRVELVLRVAIIATASLVDIALSHPQ
ncbi:hypothetical protein HMN09_01064200 [Mycena chlorophos]|uniref:Metallo-hydrolase/oxidoreductase n=1 Tax=Mycena chlorophos TaxID=658473 RepID=A0A8H6SBN2_MYCCL|nr:hypothetical protein HMN09_01064200 [Mycena chlorophos]